MIFRAFDRRVLGKSVIARNGRPPIVSDSVLDACLSVIHVDDMAKNSHNSAAIKLIIRDQQEKENITHGGNPFVKIPPLTSTTLYRTYDRMGLDPEPSGCVQTSTRHRAALEIANVITLASIMSNLADCPDETLLNTEEQPVNYQRVIWLGNAGFLASQQAKRDYRIAEEARLLREREFKQDLQFSRQLDREAAAARRHVRHSKKKRRVERIQPDEWKCANPLCNKLYDSKAHDAHRWLGCNNCPVSIC